jgi:O-antigen/teichoic acid export membrane protein
LRALLTTRAARLLVWPSFDFRGAGDIFRYGGVMAMGTMFWMIQNQADIFIAGHRIDPHALGLYSEGLFLTQIFTSKFLPPLNEVAFSAYARIQHDKAAVAAAFTKSVRLIMVIALPFYLGLAATAGPVVAVAMGPKWLEAGPIVHWLALAMPFSTLQILFAPASDACGKPGINVRNTATGMVLLPLAFLIGVHWGVTGLALAWLVVQPLYTVLTAWRTLPAIGLTAQALIAAIAPPVIAATAMMAAVVAADSVLPVTLSPLPRLLLLAGLGAVLYGAALVLFARDTLVEAVQLVRGRKK